MPFRSIMMKSTLSTLFLLFCLNSYALDVDTNVVGAKEFDKERCIQLKQENCVNNFCVLNSPISEEPNCPEICKQRAKDECIRDE